jgi:hypothetical protein
MLGFEVTSKPELRIDLRSDPLKGNNGEELGLKISFMY